MAAALSWRRLDDGSGDCDSESAALALRFRLPPLPPPLLFLDDVDVASARFSDLLKQSSFIKRFHEIFPFSNNAAHLLSPVAPVLWCLRLSFFSCFRRSRFSWDSGSRIRSALWCFLSAFELAAAKTSLEATGSLMGEISGSSVLLLATSSFPVLCLWLIGYYDFMRWS